MYLGSSGKLGKQLKWASDSGARWCLIYGNAEREAGTVTVRDMVSAEQLAVAVGEVGSYLSLGGGWRRRGWRRPAAGLADDEL